MLCVVYVPYCEAIEIDQRLAKFVVLADEVESTGSPHATKKLNLGGRKSDAKLSDLRRRSWLQNSDEAGIGAGTRVWCIFSMLLRMSHQM